VTKDGEAREGFHGYQAEVTGKWPEIVIRRVKIGQRATIYVNKAMPGDKPVVDGIMVRGEGAAALFVEFWIRSMASLHVSQRAASCDSRSSWLSP